MLRVLLLNSKYIAHPHAKNMTPIAVSYITLLLIIDMFGLLVIHLMKYTFGGKKKYDKVDNRKQ